ncbi:hypothetical protein LWI28_007756 [Acer negundo]|uniref:Uncharacterized protein n=1 Tax=Acer negundo TaxID=4023 RepID=A0AAD5IYD1_ACENE|nr:hypothetical protein LWI28_007756 [Acer negundo]
MGNSLTKKMLKSTMTSILADKEDVNCRRLAMLAGTRRRATGDAYWNSTTGYEVARTRWMVYCRKEQ